MNNLVKSPVLYGCYFWTLMLLTLLFQASFFFFMKLHENLSKGTTIHTFFMILRKGHGKPRGQSDGENLTFTRLKAREI